MPSDIAAQLGGIPYRLALAGGWIDQPFVSMRDPEPPGSMVVVAVEPEFRFMDRCGMATSTRKAAAALWGGRLPRGEPAALVRELYAAENAGRAEPSGSQDMVGLVYPGLSRIDYDHRHEGGVFPLRVQTNADPGTAAWLESVLKILPIAPRPSGYSPLGVKNLDPAWVRRLGASGRDCFAAIEAHDLAGLQASMNECTLCWEALLPATLRHPTIELDLAGIQAAYRAEYGGAMYSGCGGGYLFVATGREVPGAFGFRVRLPGKELEP
ncbi:MAG TPA: hypothetical protein PLB91_03485 [Spirochaetales bacterium]|nr:hypothetical protein [Spirochaetales bacterium]HRY55186.1 hypothetical protein [Spirochaetia bacterium]HRZ63593.1 hypothetical protein [Spirochaetia bacterium]